MTCFNYIKWGTECGVIERMKSSDYCRGKDSLIQAQQDNLVIYLAEAICPNSIPKNTAYLFKAKQPTQAITWLIAATAASAFSAYSVEKYD